ncbi:MAG: metallophosphoesterase [Candidatus Odinarchaeia archaeon]
MRKPVKLKNKKTLVFTFLLIITASFLISTTVNEKVSGNPSQPSIIGGPTVNMISNDSVIIVWRTNIAANSTVNYGTTLSLENEINDSNTVILHQIEVNDLKPNTTYYYRVKSSNITSNIYTFKTAIWLNQSFTFLVFEDNRPQTGYQQPQAFENMINLMISEKPDLVIGVGDYIRGVGVNEAETRQRWEAFTDETDKLHHTTPIYLAIGNHDTPSKSYFEEYFYHPYIGTLRYYSFDYGNSHFIILNSEEQGYQGDLSPAQINWLENDLKTTDKKHIFIFAHRPMYPVDGHYDNSFNQNQTLLNWMETLFEEYKVDIFFAGHEHLYTRQEANGFIHIISGGGGAPLYTPTHAWGFTVEKQIRTYQYVKIQVAGDTIKGWVISEENITVDEFTYIKSNGIKLHEINISLTPSSIKTDNGKNIILRIKAEVTSTYNLTTVKAYYRTTNTNTWIEVNTTKENSSSTYISEPIGPFNEDTTIEYYITANDETGYSKTTQTEIIQITIGTTNETAEQGAIILIITGTINILTIITLTIAIPKQLKINLKK